MRACIVDHLGDSKKLAGVLTIDQFGKRFYRGERERRGAIGEDLFDNWRSRAISLSEDPSRATGGLACVLTEHGVVEGRGVAHEREER